MSKIKHEQLATSLYLHGPVLEELKRPMTVIVIDTITLISTEVCWKHN